ncbi:type II secretion system minor pseudopilin GspK [Caldimonas brevitalea]|uniref:Type II secretion system protein K n=1 Tax=Caldimonas brevitalea TaxID=413882 RepID=A0A0G3BY60_9BURK|nr:type II secretion system minor pseudopilin GspK [Caldimonas brevitalea]AKJ31480.1 general secretion pathway protein K [Caldimonas brevitalea]
MSTVSHRRQRGVALLTAMIIVTLVATLASAMYWRQWRSVQIELAERGRSQSSWILSGALDWASLILAEDSKTGQVDHLSEPWATPLEEARLSTFLAADEANTDDAPEAFLAGKISDAQARYNLRNLAAADPVTAKKNLEALTRLCEQLNIDSSVPPRLAAAMRAALPSAPPTGEGSGAPVAVQVVSEEAPLLPPSVEYLRWLGLDAQSSARLAPYVTLLPKPTAVNVNTAPREVLVAVLEGVDPGSADRLVQVRQRTQIKSTADIGAAIGRTNFQQPDALQIGYSSNYFEVRGRMRIEQRVLEERSLVHRERRNITVLQRERASFTLASQVTP